MHFLRKAEVGRPTYFEKHWAMVTVELVEREKLVIKEGSIAIASATKGVQWAKLPERVQVFGPSGDLIKPTKDKIFWVTMETFNPFHGLTEAGPDGP